MKRIVGLLIALNMICSFIPAVYAEDNIDENKLLEVGDSVNIGMYKGMPVEYKVMGTRDVDGDGDDEFFLASTKIVSFKGYNAGAAANFGVTWKANNEGRQPSLRVWLNSNDTVVDYGTELDGTTQVVPVYSDQPGFLTGMTAYEQSKIVPVTQNSVVADHYDAEHEILPFDGGSGRFVTWSQQFPSAYTNNQLNSYAGSWPTYEEAAYVTTTDKIFIPSLKDLYDFFGGNVNNATAAANLNVELTSAAQEEGATTSATLLRDMYYSDGEKLGGSLPFRWNGANYVISNGPKATTGGGIRPCMYIKADTVVEETYSGSGIYQVVLPIRAEISVQQNGETVTELQAGEVSISGSARTSVPSDMIAAVYCSRDGVETMEDYARVSASDNINVTLNVGDGGDRYIGLFFVDEENHCIDSPQYIGGKPSVISAAVEPVQEIGADISVEGKKIKINGALPDDGGYIINIIVKKSDSDVIAYANAFLINENNSFDINLEIEKLFQGSGEETVEGWYDVIIETSNGSGTFKAGIAGASVWRELVDKINNGDDEYAVNSFLNKQGFEIVYNSITDKGFYLYLYKDKDEILINAVNRLIAAKPNGGYTSESVVTALNNNLIKEYFNSAAAEERFAIVENELYASVLGVGGIETEKSYLGVKEHENSERIFDGVTSENITQKLYENIVVVTVNNAENSAVIRTAIEENAQNLGIKLENEYYKLSGVRLKSLYDSFLGRKVTSKQDVIRIFDDAYKDALKQSTSSVSGGGGGGGGGGGSSSRALKTQTKEIITPDDRDDTKEPEQQTGEEGVSSPDAPFTDIEKLTWAKKAVLHLFDKGIMVGNDVGEFEPEANITREQFAKIAAIAFNVSERSKAAFDDINGDEWYAEYIYALASEGIINGINDKEFGVGKYITRQDLAVIIYRILERNGKVTMQDKLAFADSDGIADYAQEAVASLYAAGYVSGYDDNTFRGESFVTRQEAAQIIYNIIGED